MLKKFLLPLVLSLPILAQTSGQPSCQFSYTLTNRTTETPDGVSVIQVAAGIARTPQINNRQQQCNSWLMQVSVDGFSASSIEIDDSQNTYTTAGGTPSAWAAWQGTILSGTNPTTSLSTSTLISVTGYYPWVSVNLNSSTGTGNIYVTLYGWKTPVLLGAISGLPTISILPTANINNGPSGWSLSGTGAGNSILTIQSLSLNQPGNLRILPNGTSTTSQATLFNSSDSTNAAFIRIGSTAGVGQLITGKAGTAATPITSMQIGEGSTSTTLTQIGLLFSNLSKFLFTSDGHLTWQGTVPTLGTCGTSPSFGTGAADHAGTINVGSGTVTSCTINFANSFTNSPTCIVSTDSTVIIGDISAISTSSVTFGLSASLGSGHIYYHCA